MNKAHFVARGDWSDEAQAMSQLFNFLLFDLEKSNCKRKQLFRELFRLFLVMVRIFLPVLHRRMLKENPIGRAKNSWIEQLKMFDSSLVAKASFLKQQICKLLKDSGISSPSG